MTPIQPTINRGDTGEPVSTLRESLLFLLEKGALQPSPELPADVLQKLWDGVRAEHANNAAYDSAASQVVLWLSVQHGLGARFDGQVEDQTAKLLNELLRKYGGLPEPMVFAIKGRVIWGDNTRFLTGVRIRAFAAQAAGEEPLGEAETEESGVCHAA